MTVILVAKLVCLVLSAVICIVNYINRRTLPHIYWGVVTLYWVANVLATT